MSLTNLSNLFPKVPKALTLALSPDSTHSTPEHTYYSLPGEWDYSSIRTGVEGEGQILLQTPAGKVHSLSGIYPSFLEFSSDSSDSGTTLLKVYSSPSAGQVEEVEGHFTISTITATSGIVTIAPKNDKIYKYTAVASDSIVIDTPALTAAYGVNFDLLITQTTPASAITLPTNVAWIGTAPTCSGYGKTYALHIEWNGTQLVGWQKYEI